MVEPNQGDDASQYCKIVSDAFGDMVLHSFSEPFRRSCFQLMQATGSYDFRTEFHKKLLESVCPRRFSSQASQLATATATAQSLSQSQDPTETGVDNVSFNPASQGSRYGSSTQSSVTGNTQPSACTICSQSSSANNTQSSAANTQSSAANTQSSQVNSQSQGLMTGSGRDYNFIQDWDYDCQDQDLLRETDSEDEPELKKQKINV